MPSTPMSLSEIAKNLKDNADYEHLPITTRGLLRLFDAERRGSSVVQSIRVTLKSLGIETEPNFENTWIDAPIKLRLIPKPLTKPSAMAPETQSANSSEVKEEEDPTFRIGRLEAVSRPVISIKSEDAVFAN